MAGMFGCEREARILASRLNPLLLGLTKLFCERVQDFDCDLTLKHVVTAFNHPSESPRAVWLRIESKPRPVQLFLFCSHTYLS